MKSFVGERKKHPRVEIDRSLPEKKKKKKKKKKKELSTPFLARRRRYRCVDLWRRHSLSLPSRPIQFLVWGFCVFEEESCFLLFEEEEQKPKLGFY